MRSISQERSAVQTASSCAAGGPLLTWGMRLLFLILAAVTASAAEIDINAPGFWSKSYSIPGTYCDRRIALLARRPEKLVKASAPCEFRVQDGQAFSYCRLPREQSDRIVASLRKLGTLTGYSQSCDPAPEYPELTYKRDNLRREWDEVKLSSAEAPAISGLMAAQLATLDQLISAHQAALETSLTIRISTSEAETPPGAGIYLRPGAHRAHKVVMRTSRYVVDAPLPARFSNGGSAEPRTPSETWARRARPACEQLESIYVDYEKTGGPDDARLVKAALRLGSAYADPTCPRSTESAFAAAVLTSRPEREIRRTLMSFPGLRSWRSSPAGEDAVISDDRRFEMLSSELAAQRTLLERAPHMRSLVAAEIERVRENAERLRQLRGKRLLLIRFAP